MRLLNQGANVQIEGRAAFGASLSNAELGHATSINLKKAVTAQPEQESPHLVTTVIG